MLKKKEIEAIQKHFNAVLKYEFTDPTLLLQALTRESAIGIHVPAGAADFEALEFTGDRALNLAIASHLQKIMPTATPNELNMRYVALTRNSDDSKRNGGPLYRVAKEIALETFILKSDEEDLAKYGERGRRRGSNLQHKTKEWILADHIEALIGAMYQDSGHNMAVIDNFVSYYWQHLGLNDELLSDSSFGDSLAPEVKPTSLSGYQLSQDFLARAKDGNWPQALMMLDKGAMINAQAHDKKTALHYFAAKNNERAIRELLEKGALIDAKDNKKWTPIFYAVAEKKLAAFKALVAEGASLELEVRGDEDEMITILSLCAANGYEPIIDILLQQHLFAFSLDQLQRAMNKVDASKANIVQKFRIALEKKAKSQLLFDAVAVWLEDESNENKLKSIGTALLAGADAREKNAAGQTIFHLMTTEPHRFAALEIIFTHQSQLDNIALTGIVPELFGIPAATTELEQASFKSFKKLSFKHANLLGVSLATITEFNQVNFTGANLTDVSFHPEATFIQTMFTGAELAGTHLGLAGMDETTLASLPAEYRDYFDTTTAAIASTSNSLAALSFFTASEAASTAVAESTVAASETSLPFNA